MRISIRTDPDEDLRHLGKWLYSQGDIDFRIVDEVDPGVMGSPRAALVLSLESPAAITSLITSVSLWINSRRALPSVTITLDQNIIVLDRKISSGALEGALRQLLGSSNVADGPPSGAAGSPYPGQNRDSLVPRNNNISGSSEGQPAGDEEKAFRSATDALSIYLDTDDEAAARRVFRAFDDLARVLGYSEIIDEEIRRGSFWRSAKAVFRRVASSDEVALRLAKVERAVELAQLDSRQAEVDSKEAEAVSQLLETLADVPQACMRIGSLLIVKYQENSGSVVLARTLSQTEIRALNRFPEIQARPKDVMKALDTAVSADVDNSFLEDVREPPATL